MRSRKKKRKGKCQTTFLKNWGIEFMAKPVGSVSAFALAGLLGRFEMEEKRNVEKILFVFVCVIALCGVFTGCETTRIDDSGIVERNSCYIGRLEATVASLDATIGDSRERIADSVKQSKSIADGLERLEFLFGRYEQEVGKLLSEIERIRSQIEAKGENDGMDSGIFGSAVIGAGGVDNAEHKMGD